MEENIAPILDPTPIEASENVRRTWLVVGILASALVLWLGVAWFQGWFPFGYRALELQEVAQQRILNSLTAMNPATVDNGEQQRVLDSLTAGAAKTPK